jgi:hypothetical protein
MDKYTYPTPISELQSETGLARSYKHKRDFAVCRVRLILGVRYRVSGAGKNSRIPSQTDTRHPVPGTFS